MTSLLDEAVYYHNGNEQNNNEKNNYEQIAKAIAFIQRSYQHQQRQQHQHHQPDLKKLAQHLNFNEHQLQHLFETWAGVSPKDFFQCFTLEYAKFKVTETKKQLKPHIDTELSSPAQLQNHPFIIEAMLPGESKTGGKGLTIRYGIHNSPFGDCLIALTHRGVCNLHFLDGIDNFSKFNGESADSQNANRRQIQDLWPNANLSYEPKATEEVCDRIFQPSLSNLSSSSSPSNSSPSSPLTLHLKGTPFQHQVWQALLNIPFAGITTYQDLAIFMGRPTAARAIGNAIGNNPVGYLIPCHRVIRGSGELGGYRWGIGRKTALLGWEASQVEKMRSELN